MTDASMPSSGASEGRHGGSLMVQNDRTRRRKAAESRFKAYGITAIGIGLAFLVVLLVTIVVRGVPAFQQTTLTLPVYLTPEQVDPKGNRDPAEMKKVLTFGYQPLFDGAMEKLVADKGIETTLKPKEMAGILSQGALATLRNQVLANPDLVGQTADFHLLANSRVDGYLKGRVTRESIAQDKFISAEQLDLVDAMRKTGALKKEFNWNFITGADASESRPEQAGLGVSILGSFFMMVVVLVLSLPIGVAASIYLEEFAPKNWFTDMIEVNISNLAAVPSIVFGILGLAVFIQFFGGTLGMAEVFRASAPLVGGLVLTLMTLPTIIISTRAALKAVPPSIRDAALGVGASHMQAVFHHVLPLAAPGILTGTIIGLAQALGETAPLLLIGMVGFVAVTYPDGVVSGFVDPNSAMPAQIYTWASRADPAYYERAWGGIIILLIFMVIMNIIAIVLRRRFERRW